MRGYTVVAGFRAECGVLRKCQTIIPVHIRVSTGLPGLTSDWKFNNYCYCSRFKKQRNRGEGVKKQWPLKSVSLPHSCRFILTDY